VTAGFDARNRNQAWTYDAAGHLLSMNNPADYSLTPYEAPRHSYNAAGQHASMTQTLTRYQGSNYLVTTTTDTQTYDGDGAQGTRLNNYSYLGGSGRNADD